MRSRSNDMRDYTKDRFYMTVRSRKAFEAPTPKTYRSSDMKRYRMETDEMKKYRLEHQTPKNDKEHSERRVY